MTRSRLNAILLLTSGVVGIALCVLLSKRSKRRQSNGKTDVELALLPESCLHEGPPEALVSAISPENSQLVSIPKIAEQKQIEGESDKHKASRKRKSLAKQVLLLFLRAAVIAGFAVAADHQLEGTAWYRHFQEAGYKSAQYSLMHPFSPRKEDLGVRILDLSTLITRTQAHLECGDPKDDAELRKQWNKLEKQIVDIQNAKPKALLIDWELGLVDKCVEVSSDGKLRIKNFVQPGTREAYLNLMSRLAEADKQFPVLIIAQNVGERAKKKLPLFLEPASSNLACNPALRYAPHLVYAALASKEGTEGLPSAPVALLKRLEERTQLEGQRSKVWFESGEHPAIAFLNPFESSHSYEKTGEEVYWIDYSYLQTLIEQKVSVNAMQLTQSYEQAKLKDQIVVLADVTDPHFEDVFPMPLDWEDANSNKPAEKSGEMHRFTSYTGGMGNACAILTRMNRPLYTIREGGVWLGTLFLFNLVFLILGMCVSMAIGGYRDHSDRSELKQVAVDIGMVLLSAGFLVWLNAQSSWTRLLLPQYAPLMVARMLELFSVIVMVGWHLWKHSPHDKKADSHHSFLPSDSNGQGAHS